MPAPILATRQLNRTLLLRQHLLERTDHPPLQVIEHLVGLQAQEPDNPYLALWSRIRGFDPESLSALLSGRRAVRMALMRSTIHLVSADDARALRPVVQPVLDAELFRNRTWSVGLEGVDLEAVLTLGRSLVEERPRTLAELRAAMAERWPDRDPGPLAYAVRGRLPTIQVPPRGLWGRSGQARLRTLDQWTGHPMAIETAPDAMVLRYLAAFGPASVADVAAWSGLTGLRAAVDRLRPQLRAFRDELGRELVDVPEAPIADAATEAPVRFLPDYDNVLLGHADRSRVIPPPILAEVRKRIGRPAFLVDGFVAGLWSLDGGRAGPAIVLEPLRPLADDERDPVAAEAMGVLGLLAPGVPDAPVAHQPAANRLRWVS